MKPKQRKSKLIWTDLLIHAKRARLRAYSPYSRYRVGSALRTSDGKVFSGCNFENASYGATICAERNAVGQMVAQGGRKISQVLVLTHGRKPASPCGLCLQVLSEFAALDCLVAIAFRDRIVEVVQFRDLLPKVFSKEMV